MFANNHRYRSTLKQYFSYWHRFHKLKRRSHLLKHKSYRHFSKHIFQKCISRWKCFLIRQKKVVNRTRSHEQSLIANLFDKWRSHTMQKSFWRSKCLEISEKMSGFRMRCALLWWKEMTLANLSRQRKQIIATLRRDRMLMHRQFQEWKKILEVTVDVFIELFLFLFLLCFQFKVQTKSHLPCILFSIFKL